VLAVAALITAYLLFLLATDTARLLAYFGSVVFAGFAVRWLVQAIKG
jgi:hypothetical protein